MARRKRRRTGGGLLPGIMTAGAALALGACGVVTTGPHTSDHGKRWWKGNTHTHTLWSDGDGAPELVAGWYHDHGYHFLVLSDHDILSRGEKWYPVREKGPLTPQRVQDLRERFGDDWVVERTENGRRLMRLATLSELRDRFEEPGHFLFIEGEEISDSFGKVAVHVNGLEPAAHDPRALSGMGLVYATSPRGACHLQGDMYVVDMGLTIAEVGIIPGGRFKTRSKAKVVSKVQDWRTLFNSAIMCVFVNPTAPLFVRLLSEATGWSSDIVWWQRTGERIFALKRAFNNRLGVRRGNDRLPERMLIPMANGSRGRTPRMDIMLEEYYAHRGWDWQTGKPSREKLVSLGLPEIAEELWE